MRFVHREWLAVVGAVVFGVVALGWAARPVPAPPEPMTWPDPELDTGGRSAVDPDEPGARPIPHIDIVDWPITYDDERKRLTADYLRYQGGDEAISGDLEADVTMVPRVIVLHWTGAPKAKSTWWAFDPVRHGRNVDPERAVNLSTQFLVDRDGTIFRLYPETLVGRHTIGLNHLSIGVENVGGGARWPLTEAQVDANEALVRYLDAKYPITHLIGHYEYRLMEGHPYFQERDPTFRTQKDDPGPTFMAAVRERVADLGLLGPP